MIAVDTPSETIDHGICIPTATFANGRLRFFYFVFRCHCDVRLAVKESSFSAILLSINQGFAARQD